MDDHVEVFLAAVPLHIVETELRRHGVCRVVVISGIIQWDEGWSRMQTCSRREIEMGSNDEGVWSGLSSERNLKRSWKRKGTNEGNSLATGWSVVTSSSPFAACGEVRRAVWGIE
jgi:hypothetical protein